jgi:hypothetical protein
MRVGIMQPYFFPYIEYFRLIALVDLWIAFDTVKYNKKSWMSRNRILNKDKNWSYINIPIAKQNFDTSINDARIDATTNWRDKLFQKLKVYEKAAPNYTAVIEILNNILSERHDSLACFNMSGLAHLCRLLEIDTQIARLSDLSLDLPEHCAPGEWALHICKAVGASEYVNALGGRDLFDPELYQQAGIKLRFHEHINFRYATDPFEFEPDLSIIDVLMWVDTETVRDAMHDNQAKRTSSVIGVQT